ncbi:hypothetical protein [Amycolatopsis magusensis]|uniref:hypothetical protein n=1 Tax=Amycolatopsis magusensis TaxID=882444 RepID=UPI0024A80252|nr:hypothetical protein [Amycolatopsis magusensis]MDI5979895.1 hypothetical protein [Amycolatopsis magusensis]
MRPLVVTDDVPVLVRDEQTLKVVTKKATPEHVLENDGEVIAVVNDSRGPRVQGCQRSWIRIDDGGTIYDAVSTKVTIVAFVADYADATEYAAALRAKGSGRLVKEKSQKVEAAFEAMTASRTQAGKALEKGEGSTGDLKVALAGLAFSWANCGNTSGNLSNELAALCGTEQLMKNLQFTPENTGEFAPTIQKFLGKQDEVFFIDLTLLKIHTISLEVHPDGAYLVQGYQGAYTAFWWQRITDAPLTLPGVKLDDAQLPMNWSENEGKMLTLRDHWGGGRPLGAPQVGELVEGLGNILGLGKDGKWTAESHKQYIALPFYVGEPEALTVGIKDTRPATPLTFYVNVYRIKDPAQGYKTLEANGGCLSHLVLDRIFQQMTALAKTAK